MLNSHPPLRYNKTALLRYSSEGAKRQRGI